MTRIINGGGVKTDDADRSEERSDIRPGKVTSLSRQVKNPERVSIFIDGKFALGVDHLVFASSNIRVGDDVESAALVEIQEKEHRSKARHRAVNYISYRPRTTYEVKTRLVKFGYSNDIVESVVEWLASLNYINDESFVEQYVEERSSRKGYGPNRISRDLSRLGIDRSVADNALQKIREQIDLPEPAMRKAQQRWLRLSKETDPRKRKSKLVQYLLRRGFSPSTAYAVVAGLEKDDEQLE